ncbi:MAG: AraC family transcriptional regulator [Clostridiales bacterium]|nr:AraC family transcriptional regulator [Clostridiales bacterium]
MKAYTDELFFIPQIIYYVNRVCTPDWVIERQNIDFHDFTFVLSGEGEYIVDDVVYPVTKGDLVYIPPGKWREANTSIENPLELYAFNMFLFDKEFKPATLPLPVISKLEYDPKVDHLLERIRQYNALREATSNMQATAQLMDIFSQVLVNLGVVQGTGSDPRVQKAAAYVTENISRHISAAEIGAAVGIHPGYLNKLTVKHTGKTVSRFITNIRVNMAEEALVYEGISVSAAASRFGFSDIYHFSKVFKKNKGYPPSTAKTLLR